jgi:hypothetical protein
MKIPKPGRLALAALTFCLGIAASIVVPYALRKASHSLDSNQTEEMRVTSPSGKLDAVIVRDSYGGAAGGFEWYVYIMLKGKAAPTDGAHAFFQASRLSGEKLVWNEARLLEVHYDIAEIESFRNLWGLHEVQDVGPTGEQDYDVEIRLVPSSPDFSILTPAGGFR